MIVWLLLACTGAPEGGDALSLPCPPGRAVVTTTDYAVGALAMADAEGILDTVAPTSGDPLIVADGCDVLQADRAGGDRLRRWSGDDWTEPALEVALPSGTNAHGLLRHDGRILVAGWGNGELLSFDAVDGTAGPAVDLSQMADADGIPELEDVLRFDGRLWVSAQRFDRSTWQSVDGRVAVLDPEDLSVQQTIETGPSPFLVPVPGRDALLLQTGTWYAADGGLDWLYADGSLEPIWADPGEDLVGAAGHGDTLVVLSAALDGTRWSAWCVDAASGERTLAFETDSFLTDVAVAPDGIAWLTARRNVDASGQPGVLRLDVETCALIDVSPWPTLLEPWSVVWTDPGEQP